MIKVISIGRVTRQKNPFRLLEVAKIAKEHNLPVKFEWLGDGPLMDEVISKRKDMGLKDTVKFMGFVSNPFPYLKEADILMVTSDFEGFCLVICEAMCLGVPVISTRTAGPEEIIGENEYGVLTDISAESLFDALKELIENPKRRKEISEKALSRPDIFNKEKTLEGIYSLVP